MKRISIVLAAYAIAFTACQQELTFENVGSGTGGGGATSVYYIKFKMNGVAQEYKTGVTAVKGTYPGGGNLRFLSVTGRPGLAIRPALGITINDTAVIVANKTYDDTPVGGTFSSGLYNDAASNSYSTALAATPGFQCRFSEITATYVKGTFKGNLESLTVGDTIAITDGEFYARVL